MIPSLEVARRRGRSARVDSRFGQRGSICRTSSARSRVHCGARERRPRSVWVRGPGLPGRQQRLRPPSRLRPHLAPPRGQAQPRLAPRQPPDSPAPPFISCLCGGLAPDHEGLEGLKPEQGMIRKPDRKSRPELSALLVRSRIPRVWSTAIRSTWVELEFACTGSMRRRAGRVAALVDGVGPAAVRQSGGLQVESGEARLHAMA